MSLIITVLHENVSVFFFQLRHERMMKVHNYKTQDSTSIPQGDTHIARALL